MRMGVDPWKEEDTEPLELFYQNQNGASNGKRLPLRTKTAYFVCYDGSCLSLAGPDYAPRSEVIGVLYFGPTSAKRGDVNLGNYSPTSASRFRIVRSANVVNGQAFFELGDLIELVDRTKPENTLSFKLDRPGIVK
jgi:hypothetical protein